MNDPILRNYRDSGELPKDEFKSFPAGVTDFEKGTAILYSQSLV